jgi:hypothetical protein
VTKDEDDLLWCSFAEGTFDEANRRKQDARCDGFEMHVASLGLSGMNAFGCDVIWDKNSSCWVLLIRELDKRISRKISCKMK